MAHHDSARTRDASFLIIKTLQQEDYLKRQIDQLGHVLGKILADLTGLSTRGRTGDGIESANQALKAELGLNFNELTSIPVEKLMEILHENKTLSCINCSILGDILVLLAEKHGWQDDEKLITDGLFQRALAIYRHVDKTSATYSFERHNKIDKLKNR